ncbi:MAG: 3-oxoacyl-[acyl-carrier-protein] synthase 3 [Chlamydiia bacterium]|nr:3-oxoacyl-[acyl-carrier-protein] synthase 3 [Chlamydiia bacterium]MCH9615875.1 3-oxoacyl-[acyl-carrier-protein] synthase 3 [Chlamydiia bacterium]MCH9628722.1 3-oxoacyl-[acyl-carrier-protein] synthase 3 [Chlamydiia bacterium]
MRRAKIIGLGSYVPTKVLSNKDLEELVDTNDEWIVSRTGMKERRIAGAEEFTSHMGLEAAKKALSESKIDPVDIDLILFATLTPDFLFPSTACLIQKEIGASRAASMDLQAACTGYLYALSTAKAFVESGRYKNILIIAAEKLSSITNYKDRSTCVLFGDGASAAVISDEGAGFSIGELTLGSDGEQEDLLKLPAGGSRMPASLESVSNDLHYIQMEGREVYKHAVRRMESAAKECLEKLNLSEDAIRYLVPHQANIRIIEGIAKRFKVPMERVYLTIHKYGNTSASSVGIALDELMKEKKLKQSDNVMLVAFGAGLTWGAGILTYEEA